jgi:nucleoside-diphosphate-sugar epimerase
MDLVMARTFNLFGTGMSDRLFVGKIYDQIRKYKQGAISKIEFGNLTSRRDFIDVADAVKYYELIMNYGASSQIYNVGSGKSIKIGDLIKKIFDEFDLDISIIEVKTKYNSINLDIDDIYADIKKLKALESKMR